MLERQAANLLFALVSSRYERGSIFLTSKPRLRAAGEIFGDTMVAAALIGPLVPYATMITLSARATACPTAPSMSCPPQARSLRGSG